MKLIKLLLSLIIALLLLLIPLPDSLSWYRPQFVLLVIFAWSYCQPNLINMGTAFFLGLLLDVITGTLLGVHAVGLLLALYIFLLFHARICMFHRLQQSLIIGACALLNSLIIFCLQAMFSHAGQSIQLLLSVPLTAVFWPIVIAIVIFLEKPHRAMRWSD